MKPWESSGSPKEIMRNPILRKSYGGVLGKSCQVFGYIGEFLGIALGDCLVETLGAWRKVFVEQ